MKNQIHKRALSLLLSIALIFSIFSLDTVGVWADAVNPTNFNYYNNGRADTISLDLDSGPVILSIDSGANAFFQGSMADFGQDWSRFHPIDSGDSVRIYQSDPTQSTANSVLVRGTAYPINVALESVNIDTSKSGNPASYNTDTNEQNHCAFCMSASYPSNVNLTLSGDNKLKSGPLFAGLQVEEGNSLAISGDGSLTATGGTGASGIGGGVRPSNVLSNTYMGCGDITVNGGKIIANGGAAGTVATDHSTANVYGGAGIGGGGGGLTYDGGNDGNISIGGNAEVTAKGNGGGAGIGGGAGQTGGSGGAISISGGTVTANGSTDFIPETLFGNPTGRLLRSAGIGGGGGYEIGGRGGTITISGGIVTAKSSGAAMAQRPDAPPPPSEFEYGGTISQENGSFDIYYGYLSNYNQYCFRTASALAVIPTDGAAIGSGGNTQPEIMTSQAISPHNDSENGGAITISGGTVTAQSTVTTGTVLGGTGIGNSEESLYNNDYHNIHLTYTLLGSCVFTGGSINSNLTGSCAVAPAPTDGHGNPVYKTAAQFPEINAPVTVTPAGSSSSFPAQTDAQGGLSVWLPATNDTNTVAARVSVVGTDRSYEMKGAVTTDGTSQLKVLRTDAGLDNLTFDGKEASPTSTSGLYQVNLASSATQVTVQKKLTSDLKSFTINGKPHSGTDTVALAISAPETDLSIQIVGQDNSVKNYTIRVIRAARNDAAMTSLSVDGMPKVPDSDGAYRNTVSNSVTHVKVCAIPENPDATYTVLAGGRTLTPGTDGADVTLGDVGSTTDISIVVRSEDGTTQKTYRLFLLRASETGSTSSPSLPSGLTDASTGVQADLSGAVFASNVTSISLSTSKPAQSDRQAADFRTSLLAGSSTGVINIPQLCSISLLDQNGNPVSFTGTVRVKIPLPAGVRGTPHVFRCEPDTQKFTDMNAVVENGYLVFSTDHFGEYAIAGVGNAIVLDTLNYQMPVNGNYQIGLRLPGTKATSVKYYSTNDKAASVVKLKNGNYQVIGKGTGTAYIMFDVYDNKNRLLTHASVRVDVKTGIRPRGDSTRQFGIF